MKVVAFFLDYFMTGHATCNSSCLFSILLLSSGPEDYVDSMQEERELVQILCGDDAPVEITISDSDGDFVPPSPQRLSVQAAKMHLKLKNSHGEYILWSWKNFNQVDLS